MSTQETDPEVLTKDDENITVKATKQPNCLVKFEISVTPQAVSAAYAKALKNVNKEVSIPGFRKGKAPNRLILERYEPTIHKEWVDLVLQVAFNEAIHLTRLHPLKDGLIKRPAVHECSQEKGARFTIEFESKPVIPSIDLNEIKLAKLEPTAISQEQKDMALEQVLNQLTTYEPIQDRAAQEGDYVDLDVDTLENPPKRLVENQRVKVDDKELPSWLREKVIGLKPEETAEGQTDLPSPENEGQSIPFKVTVKAIWLGLTPAVDDELAKKVGLESLEDLRQKIKRRLEGENENETQQRQMRELENLLLDKYPIDLPNSLIESDKKTRLAHYEEQLKRDHQEAYLKANRHRIEEMIEKSSKRALQLFFLLRKTATDHGIDASDEDVNQELNRQLSLIASGQSNIDIYDRENLSNQLYALALDRKIKLFLLDNSRALNDEKGELKDES